MKKDEIFLGTINIQVGPKGFFPWIWDLLKSVLLVLVGIILFFVVALIALCALSAYVAHHP